jgi:hypothetical protein
VTGLCITPRNLFVMRLVCDRGSAVSDDGPGVPQRAREYNYFRAVA